ncbi:hypothetical protein VDG1235_737 [Verrucomicrobiia bacterium DG1235]|nr:hypothetical protein VDG1235_737 [Verrucomicrobiae bacterium DG1235]
MIALHHSFLPKSLVASIALSLLACASLATETFFVSPLGNDQWSGRLSAPTEDGQDGPFATLQRAQTATRQRNADTSQAREDIRVILRGGYYSLSESLVFTEADSGTEYAPIEWSNYPGETVLLSGGAALTGAETLSKTHPLYQRIPSTARPHVQVVDLPSLGIRNFGSLARKGFQIPFAPSSLQLYADGRPMTLARYPNSDWTRIADVPKESGEPFHPGHHSDRRYDDVPTGRHFGKIEYDGNRPDSWTFDHDIWVHGYWTWDWADSSERISKIDTNAKYLTLAPPYHRYGITKGQRYFYYNIPEELDTPGEWYLDRTDGKLYYWPPSNSPNASLHISLLDRALISVSGASNLRFSGFDFAYSRSVGIEIADSHHVTLSGCHFYALSGTAVTINGGNNCGVSDSHFEWLDAGCLKIDGGDRTTLSPGNHYATNNHFHDFGLVYRTNNPAIHISGVGHRAAHNLIHDAPHMALFFRGNDHLIEYNEIHHIAKETGDVGAIYTGRDYTSRGTIVRFNYLHDLIGPGLHGVRGVYLDDFTSGIVIYGNLFVRAGRAAFIGGGRDNLVQNNVFIDCEPSVQVDGRGLSWAVHHFDQSHSSYASTLRDRMAEANATQAPYATRYPSLVTLYNDEPRVPKYNKIQNNLSFGGIFLDLYDGADTELVTVSGNLIGDPIALRMTEESDQSPDFTTYRPGAAETRKVLSDNQTEKTIPRDAFFQVKEGRPVINYEQLPQDSGFIPLPVSKMGLQAIETSH